MPTSVSAIAASGAPNPKSTPRRFRRSRFSARLRWCCACSAPAATEQWRGWCANRTPSVANLRGGSEEQPSRRRRRCPRGRQRSLSSWRGCRAMPIVRGTTSAPRTGKPFSKRWPAAMGASLPTDTATLQSTVTYWRTGLGPTPDQLKAGGWRRAGIERSPAKRPSTLRIGCIRWGIICQDVSVGGWTNSPGAPSEPPEDPCGEDFGELKRRLWPAMAAFEADVEQLDANPQSAGPRFD
jgi:hypothetical protein